MFDAKLLSSFATPHIPPQHRSAAHCRIWTRAELMLNIHQPCTSIITTPHHQLPNSLSCFPPLHHRPLKPNEAAYSATLGRNPVEKNLPRAVGSNTACVKCSGWIWWGRGGAILSDHQIRSTTQHPSRTPQHPWLEPARHHNRYVLVNVFFWCRSRWSAHLGG